MRQIIMIFLISILSISCRKTPKSITYFSIPIYSAIDSFPLSYNTYKIWWAKTNNIHKIERYQELIQADINGVIIFEDQNALWYVANKDANAIPPSGDYYNFRPQLKKIDPADFIDTIYYFPVYINP